MISIILRTHASKYLKSILLSLQQSKLVTHIARMYRNTVSVCRGDRLNLQSDTSFSRVTNYVLSGIYIREAVFLKSGNEVEAIGER